MFYNNKKRKKIFYKHFIKIIFFGLIFSFFSSFLLFSLIFVANIVSANELIEHAFMPAKNHETIINLGNTKDAVGNEILRESLGVSDGFGIGCMVQGQHISESELKDKMKEVGFSGSPEKFCVDVLGGDEDVPFFASKAPLIVRITKFLLRITIVFSITMVIYSGIMYIIEASKGADVKNATTNLMYIIGGVLLALMSLGLINLISSLSISSLNIQ